MKKPRAVLFDWDNTLVESWGIIHESLRLTFLDLGREPWTFEQTKAWVRRSMRDSFPDLFGADAARSEHLFYKHYREHHLHRLTPLAGAVETLEALHGAGLPLGVVSSKQGALVREEAAQLGWGGYFGRIVGANDGPEDKPAPEAVTLALDGTGISSGPDVWYVGDTGIDVTCARNAGCTAVIVSADPPRDGECPRVPDHQFANHAGLHGFLREHGITI